MSTLESYSVIGCTCCEPKKPVSNKEAFYGIGVILITLFWASAMIIAIIKFLNLVYPRR